MRFFAGTGWIKAIWINAMWIKGALVLSIWYLVLLSLAAPAMACVEAPSGLVSWWPASNSAKDAFGTNHGTLQNGTTYAAGYVGRAFSFNGTNNVVVPDSPSLNPASGLTLEAWIYYTGSNGGEIISKDGETSNRQYLLAIGAPGGSGVAGHLRAHIGVASGFQYFDGATLVQPNTWHHVAMTYDGASLKAYLNGALDGTLSVSGSIVPCAEPVRIGGGAPNGLLPYYFPGLIDEPSLYNRALSPAEIQAIYAAGREGKCPRVVDALIKASSEANTAYALNNVYQQLPSGAQVERQSVSRGNPAFYLIKIQNDGGSRRTFRVRAVEGIGAGWTIIYRRGITDISTSIKTAGGYVTGILAPGQSEIITVKMTPTAGASANKGTTLKVFFGAANTITRDAVKAVTTVAVSSVAL